MGIIDHCYSDLPLTVKIARFMYGCKNYRWVGCCRELAASIMMESADELDLKSRIAHAVAVLKKEGVLSEGSGFMKRDNDTILLQLAEYLCG